MPTPAVNSLEWWEDYFQGAWEANSGPAQTRHFMELLIGGLPRPVRTWLQSGQRSVLDWGCALGDGVDALASAFPGCRVAGLDFSAEAIARARARYPGYAFIHTPDGRSPRTFDVVACSNCLEHFDEPLTVAAGHLASCASLYVALVPYGEEPLLECHRARFTEESFPPRLGEFIRVSLARMDPDPRFWGGQQMLVVYASPAWLNEVAEPARPRQHPGDAYKDGPAARGAVMSITPNAETWQEVSKSYTLEPQPLNVDLAADLLRVLESAGVQPPATLLEAGCGSGHLSLLLRRAGYRTDLLDFSDGALAVARESYRAAFGPQDESRFILGDLMKLSDALEGRKYDVVWNSGVMEHFSRDVLRTAFTQMRAAARDKVLFLVPNPGSLFYLAYRAKALSCGQWGWGVEFLREDYIAVAEASGLRVAAHGYCGRGYTLGQLEFVISSEDDRKLFRHMLESGQAAGQTLGLQYFLCEVNQQHAPQPMRVADDGPTFDRTFYLDAMGNANAAIARLQRDLETVESQLAGERAALQELRRRADAQAETFAAKVTDMAATTQLLNALCAQKELRSQTLVDALEAQRRQVAELSARLTATEQAALQKDQSLQQLAVQVAEVQSAAEAARQALADQLGALQAQLADRDRQIAELSARPNRDALALIRSDALATAGLLESWKLHKGFRTARMMQLVNMHLMHGSLGERARFVGRALARPFRKGKPLSSYNAFDPLIHQAYQIAATVDRLMQDPGAGAAILPEFARSTASTNGGVAPALPAAARPARTGVVNILTNLFLDFGGKEMMCGGAERYLIELCRLIRELGYRPEIYQCGHGSWVREYDGTRVIGIDVGDDINRLNPQFHRDVPEGALTIYSAFTLAQPYCHRNSLGIGHGIFWDNAEIFQTSPAVYDATVASLRRSASNCSHVVSVDTNTINWVRATFAPQAGKFSYVPNFVEIEQFKPVPRDDEGKVVVLYPRRLYAPRGFWITAEVVPYFLNKYPNVSFHFVGKADDKETRAVKALQAQYGDRVRWYFLDPDRMHEAYREADIALVPTLASEGTSLSCLEAMASGNAIIATNVGGLPELITDGHNGLLISPTVEDLRSAIERLVTDHDLRRRLSQTARHVALSYSTDVWRDRWRSVLRRMLPAAAEAPSRPMADREFVHLWAGGVVWDRMKQRPQQLFRAIAEAGRKATFVCDEQVEMEQFEAEGRLRLVGRKNRLDVPSPILYIFFSYNYQYIKDFENPTVIYDILDDPKIYEEADRGAPPDANYLHYHSRLLMEADIVMTSSRRLWERFRAQRSDILLVPNAVRPEDFRRPAGARPRDLPAKGPIVGYYGAIAEWFDYALLAHAAQARPDLQFVLIGPATRRPQLDEVTARFPNVRYLGEKPYEQLAGYLAHFDVAIIPFVVNEVTNSVSPVKLFEYLAGGKPVVSTGFEEVRPCPAALIAEDAADFVAKLDEALKLKGDAAFGARAEQVVAENTWRERANQVIAAVNRLEAAGSSPSPGAPHGPANALARALAGRKGPVFCFPSPSVPWGYMFQRPQQLARSLVSLGYPVIYSVDPSFPYEPDHQVRDVMPIAGGPLLYADNHDGEQISQLDRPVICWQYWPHQARYMRRLPKGSYRIYDCIDDVSCFSQYPELAKDHAEAMTGAGLVLASADDLMAKVSRERPDVVHVPNGAWYEDFANPKRVDWPELDALRARSKVLVGYYGALAEWLDWDLLEAVVKARRDWNFLLVGELVGHDAAGSYERGQRLAAEPNVTLMPRQAYERLGYLLSVLDVAIIPFRVLELTHAVSPIKLFEYMAGGKPVVSTPLRECAKYPPIRLAGTPDEFVQAIERSLVDGRSAEHRADLQRLGAENSWMARAQAVVDALKQRGVLA